MKKNTNKGKKKVFDCAHFEFEYDDLDKYRWCHNPDSGCRECMCDDIFQMNVCPFFKRGNRASFLEMTDYYKDSVKQFLEKIQQKAKEKEIEERAMLKYLKEKYEN